MTLIEMKDRRATVQTMATEVRDKARLDGRKMTEAEIAQVNKCMAEAEELTAAITAEQRIQAGEEAIKTVETRKTVPQKPEASGVASIEFPRMRHGSMRAFRAQQFGTRVAAEEAAYRTGLWLAANIWGNERALAKCIDLGIERRVAGESVNSKGGALVPVEMATAIIDLREEYGLARKVCKIESMSGDTKTVSRRTGGLTAYAVGENAEVTASEKSWDQVELTARKWGVLARYSAELSEDAIISIADDLTNECGYAFANKEDDCLFNGTGTSSYHGIVGILPKLIDGNHAGSYYTAASGNDLWSEFTDADLLGVMGKLPLYALKRMPKWYCPVGAAHLVFGRLLRAAGGTTATESAGAVPTKYAGYEIIPVPAWTDTSTSDLSSKIGVLFGCMDLAVTMGNRTEFRVKVSEDRYLENDQIAILGITRFDINVHDIGSSSVAGPVVGLYGN